MTHPIAVIFMFHFSEFYFVRLNSWYTIAQLEILAAILGRYALKGPEQNKSLQTRQQRNG